MQIARSCSAAAILVYVTSYTAPQCGQVKIPSDLAAGKHRSMKPTEWRADGEECISRR